MRRSQRGKQEREENTTMTSNILNGLVTDAVSLDCEINEKTDRFGQIQDATRRRGHALGCMTRRLLDYQRRLLSMATVFRGSDKLIPNGSRGFGFNH
jgi:hypothetical protein